MFTPEMIKERVRKQPFVPVRIVTSAGQAFDVYHPDMIWIGQRDIHIGTPSKRDQTIYDQTTRVALLHVTALEDLPARRSKGGNGKR